MYDDGIPVRKLELADDLEIMRICMICQFLDAGTTRANIMQAQGRQH